ncbi:MAG: sulfite reductase subunit alpha [Acetobacteraceae bacterium]|nr:sulfite reductase subunit alpha [Acetobacteraceae bacterium]
MTQNLAPPIPTLIPDNAPFSPAQRAWLNGFLAGLYGSAATPQGTTVPLSNAPPPPAEDFPWHDPALSLEERQSLAAGRPLAQRLMAATAQLDCGQCGYLCQSYTEALAEGREIATGLCVPGGKATQRLIKQLLAEAPKPAVTTPVPAAPAAPSGRPVRVVAAHRLTAPGSAKDVRHVVIDLEGSGLTYEPGDSIGLAAPNDPTLVEACIAALNASGSGPVPCHDGKERPLREALTAYLDIARPLDRTLDLLAMHATHPGQAAMLRKLSDGDERAEPQDADLLDLLTAFPSARVTPAELAASLPALRPRLYSVASSLHASPSAVHLCVRTVRDERRGRIRNGVASSFLADRALDAGPVQAFVQTSHFRMPADAAVPMIMVGPGTGIAPFRAFLAERATLGVKGRTWLFFGEQHEATDFLFREELTGWLADGTLSRLDTAFSRDQRNKIYVQHRMLENAVDLWRWLQQGAIFYVCGDANRMAKDVDAALRRIARTEGALTEAQATDWIVALARQGRYQRDIY